MRLDGPALTVVIFALAFADVSGAEDSQAPCWAKDEQPRAPPSDIPRLQFGPGHPAGCRVGPGLDRAGAAAGSVGGKCAHHAAADAAGGICLERIYFYTTTRLFRLLCRACGGAQIRGGPPLKAPGSVQRRPCSHTAPSRSLHHTGARRSESKGNRCSQSSSCASSLDPRPVVGYCYCSTATVAAPCCATS